MDTVGSGCGLPERLDGNAVCRDDKCLRWETNVRVTNCDLNWHSAHVMGRHRTLGPSLFCRDLAPARGTQALGPSCGPCARRTAGGTVGMSRTMSDDENSSSQFEHTGFAGLLPTTAAAATTAVPGRAPKVADTISGPVLAQVHEPGEAGLSRGCCQRPPGTSQNVVAPVSFAPWRTAKGRIGGGRICRSTGLSRAVPNVTKGLLPDRAGGPRRALRTTTRSSLGAAASSTRTTAMMRCRPWTFGSGASRSARPSWSHFSTS
jgi:hypothetical protein